MTAEPRGVERRPRPEDGREADRAPSGVARDQLHALALGVGDQRAASASSASSDGATS